MTGGVHSVAGSNHSVSQVVFIVLQGTGGVHSVAGTNHDRWCS